MKKEEIRLSGEFFELLKKYRSLIVKTGDKNFDEYVKNFYTKNLSQRKDELRKQIRSLNNKIYLLNNFKNKLFEYEMNVSEQNWSYQTFEEREQNFAIYRFLCKNLNVYARRKNMQKFQREIRECEEELKAIDSLDNYPERKDIISNLFIADSYYEKLEKAFRIYLTENKSSSFAKKYGKNVKSFNRKFFDSHLKEISDLQDGQQITFEF